MKSITAADANRNFSSLLRDVSQGEEVTVISRGTPVARIVGITAREGQRQAAKSALLARLRAQKPIGVRNWTRAELYE